MTMTGGCPHLSAHCSWPLAPAMWLTRYSGICGFTLVLTACCLGIFARSHFFANLVLLLGSSVRGGAQADLQLVRGKQRRSFWTHLRRQCASHFYLIYDDVFSTVPRNVGNAANVSLKTPSPEHDESFPRRCWTPRKSF